MDTLRFDNWAKQLAPANGSRRGVLRLALGAGLAGLAGGAFAGEALACRKDGGNCKRNGQCCSGQCKKGRNGKRTCKAAPGAFGCKITQDTCRFPEDVGLIQCPKTSVPGVCVGLKNGRPFCARGSLCVECASDAACTELAGGVPGHCITGCKKCDESGGQVCVYPRVVDVVPPPEGA